LEKNIPDNSIDFCFTDPPYKGDCVPLFETLGNFLFRVLKEGACTAIVPGQVDMDLKMERLKKAGLKFLWPFCIHHSGHSRVTRGYGTYITPNWKPALLYIKTKDGEKPIRVEWEPAVLYIKPKDGKKRTNTEGNTSDYIKSEPPDKTIHDWAQSPVEADHLIRGFTVENQIVLDPLMGPGTFGIAALKLNRKFIGIEINPDHFSNAQIGLSSISKL
jgi:hypothetical protein